MLLEGQPDDAGHQAAQPDAQLPGRDARIFRRDADPARGAAGSSSTEDRAGQPRVALVGASAARRLWPGRDPIGQRVRLPSFIPGDQHSDLADVVGVVSDVRYRGLNDVRLDVYDAALQARDAGDRHGRAHRAGIRRGSVAPVQCGGAAAGCAGGHRSRHHDGSDRGQGDGAVAVQRLGAHAVRRDRVRARRARVVRARVPGRRGTRPRVRHPSGARRAASGRHPRGAVASPVWRVARRPRARPVAAAAAAPAAFARCCSASRRSTPRVTRLAIGLVLAVVMFASYLPARRAASIEPLALLCRGEMSGWVAHEPPLHRQPSEIFTDAKDDASDARQRFAGTITGDGIRLRFCCALQHPMRILWFIPVTFLRPRRDRRSSPGPPPQPRHHPRRTSPSAATGLPRPAPATTATGRSIACRATDLRSSRWP